MGNASKWAATLATLLALFARPAAAQGGWTGAWFGGFWGGIGFGHGSANTSCDNCGAEPGFGVSGFNVTTAQVRVGGTPTSNLRAGLGLDAWSQSPNGYNERMIDLSMLAYYYPLGIKRGLFVGGGLGYSRYTAATNPQSGVPGLSGNGLGLTAQAGFDLRVTRKLALTPIVTYAFGDVGDVNLADGGGNFLTGWKQHYFAVGLSLTYFTRRGAGIH